MQTTMRSNLLCLMVALSILGYAPGYAADAQEPAADASATAQPAATVSEAQRKKVLLANIPFGKDEGDGFWPIFRDYRRDVGKLRDQRAKVVAEYAETFRTMTGDQAKSMVESLLSADEGIVKVRRDYVKKFRKFLPETKVARVFLIDDRIDAAMSALLFAQVPVVVEPAQSQ